MQRSNRKPSTRGPAEATRSSALVRPWDLRAGAADCDAFEDERANAEHFEELNLVWAQLRGDWSWLALVRAEPGESPAPIARALCQIGARLSPYPVEFLEAKEVDLDSSCRLIGRLGTAAAAGSGWDLPGRPRNGPDWALPIVKTIVALESPLANSLALPLALAADGVVLCVRRGHDRLSSVRETIAAVGAQRIICCVLVG
jgi:hypothetical protein